MPGAPVLGQLSGVSVRRREDPALLTGPARFVDDLSPAGTLALAHLGAKVVDSLLAPETVLRLLEGTGD
jgi:hypothetical protein